MKLAILTATAMAVATSSAFAAPFPPHPDSSTTVKFTFTTFCDGLTLHQKPNGTAIGTHTGSCAGNTYAGGLRSEVGGKTIWTIITNDSDDPNGFEMYVLNEKALTWTLYEMTNGEAKFNGSEKGTLTVGAPTSGVAAPMKRSNGTVAKR